ncbi:asparaginase [Gleimia hominis]|uniref:Asparaginase n=1 Tax=Gleimia hominis TaxID=595468 RepID=A0ABU3IC78_9ACTO|nr:asparaginase [Gleimia hominis]MDT3767972.1 asparaginase [Gleimia hominis]
MRIGVVYTGGTLGMVQSERGLVPGDAIEDWLNSVAPEFGHELVFTRFQKLLDSSNMAPHLWQKIVDHIEQFEGVDSVVVLHGTDTLAYTSSALAFALSGTPIPIIVTGSQLPMFQWGSDAKPNVMGALTAATWCDPGVYVYFAGEVLKGARVCKTSATSFKGFASPEPPLAQVGVPWRHLTQAPRAGTRCEWGRKPKPFRDFDVPVIDLVPGLKAERLEAMLYGNPDAVILRAFGVGNGPSNNAGFMALLRKVSQAGMTVVVASQCIDAAVEFDSYETGYALREIGAVSAATMTTEATYAKVQFLLAQGCGRDEIEHWMRKNMVGELRE